MPAKIDLTGDRFGRLIVVSESVERRRGKVCWVCQCDCGSEAIVAGTSLTSSTTLSCGCLHREMTGNAARKHGYSKTATYASWAHMIGRCLNETDAAYWNYGGRGIKVLDRWLAFEEFLADMGECPPGLTLERRNCNGHYEAGNCEWATRKVQNRNRRTVPQLEFAGAVKSLPAWAEEVGLSNHTVRRRLMAGWSIEKTLTTPSRQAPI